MNHAIKPWYKEPYVWLIIALPASAIVAGIYTLFLAIVSYDGLVVDDYYKEGLAINKRLGREENASSYKLQAEVQTSNNTMRLYLNAENNFMYPDNIHVTLSHATRQGFDQSLVLKHINNNLYEGDYEQLVKGHWNVILEQDDWRLLKSLYYYN